MLSLIHRFKEWVNFEKEYTQTKVEQPNKVRFAKYLLIVGIIILVLAIAIAFVVPLESIVYESIRYKRLEPYNSIMNGMFLGSVIIIVGSLIVFVNAERTTNKKEV